MLEKYLIELNILITKFPYLKTVILSFLLVIFFIVIRSFLSRSIDKKTLNNQEKTLLKRRLSQYLTYIFILSIFFIWFSQLQMFFVSIFAVAAAIVVALKELIMCVTGGVLVKVSNVFSIGHRVDVDGSRGFVIEKNLLTTKILEIGPEKNSQQTTGDVITIPNSIMLSKSLKNESYFKGYSIKSFVFRIEDELTIERFESEILRLAHEITSPYIEEAKVNINHFCEKEAIFVPSIDPKTKVILEGGKDFSVLVKLPVPNSEVASIEQKLYRFFLDWKVSSRNATTES